MREYHQKSFKKLSRNISGLFTCTCTNYDTHYVLFSPISLALVIHTAS